MHNSVAEVLGARMMHLGVCCSVGLRTGAVWLSSLFMALSETKVAHGLQIVFGAVCCPLIGWEMLGSLADGSTAIAAGYSLQGEYARVRMYLEFPC
jgi:hypothetical protein